MSKQSKLEKFLKIYLEKRPISHVLWRSAEYRELIRLNMNKPILDLGCGDGFFASILFDSGVDAGIDMNKKEVNKASSLKVYKELYAIDAKKMPFASKKFNTVLSNCVMEHVKPLDEVLEEVSRVLKKNGIFIFTVPSDYFNKMLFFPNIFRKFGLGLMEEIYIKNFNKVIEHLYVRGPNFWRERLKKVGLRMISYKYFMDSKAMMVFDLITPFGAISRLWLKVFNKRTITPRFLWTWLIKGYFYNLIKNDCKFGGGLIMIAKKYK